MQITPDEIIYRQWGLLKLNATILYTWLVMGVLVLVSWLITRNLTSRERISRGQNLLEVIVLGVVNQIRDVSQTDESDREEPRRYLPFVGTLFIFIALSNLLSIVPGYQPPTGSLSTTAGLAICVFVAVPIFGIARQGLGSYLRQYLEPTIVMLPFNIIGELSRTLALAVRLFGNAMSGAMIAAMLLAIAPLFVPILMQALGLLTGLIHAYIFAVLTMVYIAAATRAHEES